MAVDFDYEHRFAEHEHDSKTRENPGMKGSGGVAFSGKINVNSRCPLIPHVRAIKIVLVLSRFSDGARTRNRNHPQ